MALIDRVKLGRKRGRKPRAWRITNEVAGTPHPAFATQAEAMAAARQTLYQFAAPLLAEVFESERKQLAAEEVTDALPCATLGSSRLSSEVGLLLSEF